MPTLFRRLKKIGYDEEFLRRVVLPDWWDDALADDPTSRVQIELRVAQRLSLPLADVANPEKPRQLARATDIRLKRAKAGMERADVLPGLIAARGVSHLRDATIRIRFGRIVSDGIPEADNRIGPITHDPAD